MSTIADRGYTFRLALRHLFSGWMRPHVSIREAQSAGIGERGRIVLFAMSMGLYCSLNSMVRSAFSTYFESVRQTSGAGNWALGVGIIVVALSLLLLVLYAVESIVLYASLRVCTADYRSFAGTRFLVAIGGWIVTLPVSIAYLVSSRIVEVPSPALEASILPAWFAGVVVTAYVVLCVSEVAGVSLMRSLVVVLIALLGCQAIYTGLDAALEHFNNVLLGFIPDEDFV